MSEHFTSDIYSLEKYDLNRIIAHVENVKHAKYCNLKTVPSMWEMKRFIDLILVDYQKDPKPEKIFLFFNYLVRYKVLDLGEFKDLKNGVKELLQTLFKENKMYEYYYDYFFNYSGSFEHIKEYFKIVQICELPLPEITFITGMNLVEKMQKSFCNENKDNKEKK